VTPTETGVASTGAADEPWPGAFDEYVSDPKNPVPYTRRPIRPSFQGSEWQIWQALDQRFVDHRTDVLSFESDVLDRDIVIAGDVVADLFASTSGTDSDWIVKLIDVYPEAKVPPPELGKEKDEDEDASPDLRGYQLMIAGDVLRGRFRSSFSQPKPIAGPSRGRAGADELHGDAALGADRAGAHDGPRHAVVDEPDSKRESRVPRTIFTS